MEDLKTNLSHRVAVASRQQTIDTLADLLVEIILESDKGVKKLQ